MKKMLFLSLSLLLLGSCNTSENKKYLPDSVGAINSLSLIIDNTLWNADVGDEIRTHFAAPVYGLPWEEPLFSIQQMDPQVFTGFARNSRNILIITKGVSGYKIDHNRYAKHQNIGIISATTDQELIEQIQKYAPELIALYKKHDVEEQQRRIKRSLNKETALEETLGISLRMPSVYKTVKQENNFFWIERQILKGTMNIIVYELPVNAISYDSSSVETIIKIRDSIGQRYIPGGKQGSYMITEKAYAPYVFDAKIAGKKAIETRGMWEVKNDFMAGPFLNYMVRDSARKRILVLEGFVFAPATEKRNYMFELEAILKSLRIK